MKQSCKSGQQGHVDGTALVSTQTVKFLDEAGAQRESFNGSTMAFKRRPLTVGRPRKHREITRQLPLPVSQVLRPTFGRTRFSLPLGKIAILQAWFQQR